MFLSNQGHRCIRVGSVTLILSLSLSHYHGTSATRVGVTDGQPYDGSLTNPGLMVCKSAMDYFAGAFSESLDELAFCSALLLPSQKGPKW